MRIGALCQIGRDGVGHNVAVDHGCVEAVAIASTVLLLDGATHIACGVQVGDRLAILGQNVAARVDGKAAGREVERGNAGAYPNSAMRIDQRKVLAAEFVFFAGLCMRVVRVDRLLQVVDAVFVDSLLNGVEVCLLYTSDAADE